MRKGLFTPVMEVSCSAPMGLFVTTCQRYAPVEVIRFSCASESARGGWACVNSAKKALAVPKLFQYPELDSNQHARRHSRLKTARLPISPPG